MSADVNIPDPININGDVSLGGGLDLNLDDLDLGLDNVRINNLPNFNLNGNFSLSSLAPVNLSGDLGISKLPEIIPPLHDAIGAGDFGAQERGSGSGGAA